MKKKNFFKNLKKLKFFQYFHNKWLSLICGICMSTCAGKN